MFLTLALAFAAEPAPTLDELFTQRCKAIVAIDDARKEIDRLSRPGELGFQQVDFWDQRRAIERYNVMAGARIIELLDVIEQNEDKRTAADVRLVLRGVQMTWIVTVNAEFCRATLEPISLAAR